MCIVRPALGCIVEGEGERESFPSLIHRLCHTIIKPIQIAQADSNGDITANLEDKLTDLADTHAPITIIVCLDLVDALHNNTRFTCCKDLLLNLQTRASQWMQSNKVINMKLPQQISIVAVIPTFDGWLFADIEAIKRLSYADLSSIKIPKTINNVDVDINNPKALLKQLFPNTRINPLFVRDIVSRCNPIIIERKSRSFRNFAKELRIAKSKYDDYLKSNFGS